MSLHLGKIDGILKPIKKRAVENEREMCEVGDKANEKPSKESDKSDEDLEEYEERLYGDEERLYDDEERAHRIFLDNKKNLPLLRLPGELRNKIYDFLTIDDDIDFTLDTSNLIVSLRKYKVFTKVSRQLRKELHSYILYHGVFYMKYEDLDRFDRSFANKKMLRISNLALDITDASSKIDAAPPTARKLTPLCKEGRLRRIIIEGVYGCWKIKKWSGAYCVRTMDLVEDLSVLMIHYGTKSCKKHRKRC
ncbi:hypothetical protein G6514_002674 [Epicoccum nigrum]|nr:hypothetical protein G6514_002674 [Epicoccum nigrum]